MVSRISLGVKRYTYTVHFFLSNHDFTHKVHIATTGHYQHQVVHPCSRPQEAFWKLITIGGNKSCESACNKLS